MDYEKKIIKSLCVNNHQDILLNLNMFLDRIEGFNKKFYYRSLNRVVRTLYEELRDINPLITRQLNLNSLEVLLNSINNYENIYQKREYLTDFIKKASELITQKGEVKDDSQINRIISYIVNNYDNSSLGAQMIADYMDLNPSYMQSMFKKETKISLHEYINNYRLKKSIELLESTSLSVKNILQQIGFTNEQSFFRLFKKEYNRTPNQYRNSLKSSHN